MRQSSIDFSRKLTYWLEVVSLGMILGLGLQFAQAWTAPTSAPPTSSIAGPITTGNVGQSKLGNLALNTAGTYANALVISNGDIIGPRRFSVLSTVNSGVYDDTTSDSPYSRVDADSFHTNGLGMGQLFIEGRALDSNSTIQIGAGLAGGQLPRDVVIGNNDELYVVTNTNRVGIGTSNPSEALDVSGTVKANRFCIGSNCINAWPSAGSTYTAGTGIAISGNVISATGGADNLGNHTATQNLLMANFDINNAKNIYGRVFYDNDNAGYYVDPNGTSFLNSVGVVGNYTTTNGNITTTNGTISGKQICINGSCQGSWPSGGSGTVTSLSAGNGIALSPNPIVGAGTISWNHTATQALNMANFDINAAKNVNATAFYYTSDRRFKENIEALDEPLAKVLQLDGISFQWKKDGRKDIGVIAQDVEKVFPELVKTDPSTGFKSVEYGNFVAPLIEAVKEQQKEIEMLKVEIESLKNR